MGFVKQLVAMVAVALLVNKLTASATAAKAAAATPKHRRIPWAGAGADPFGTSYTVTGKAARGGL